jgi:hypothetical protein
LNEQALTWASVAEPRLGSGKREVRFDLARVGQAWAEETNIRRCDCRSTYCSGFHDFAG